MADNEINDDEIEVDARGIGAVICLLSAVATVSFAAWLAGWLFERFGG